MKMKAFCLSVSLPKTTTVHTFVSFLLETNSMYSCTTPALAQLYDFP